MPNRPMKNLPTKVRCLKISGKFPMGLGIPPLEFKTLLESNPPKSGILARRLAAAGREFAADPRTQSLEFQALRLKQTLDFEGCNSQVQGGGNHPGL